MVEQVEERVARAAAPVWRPVAVPFDLRRVLASPRTLTITGLGLAISLGIIARLPHVLAVDFPLNDGGLFYNMIRDLQDAHYVLPSHTTYNSVSIPYAYPPLGFYIAGAIDSLTPASLLDVLRFLPMVISALTIVAVYYLSRALGLRSPAPELAAIIFALLPRGYRWLIVGGGLTRGLGLLFALAALYELCLLYRGRRKSVWPAIAYSSLTVLSHPEMSWYIAFGMALLLLAYGLRRDGVLDSVRVIGAATLLTMPWWLSVLVRSGPDPFLSAAQTGGHSGYVWRDFLYWHFTELSMVNWPAMLAILGAIVCIAQGQLFLPAWLVASLVLEPRSGPTFISVPIAMLSAVAITKFVLPLAGTTRILPPDWLSRDGVSSGQRRLTLASMREQAPALARKALPSIAVGLFVFYMGFLALREVLQPDPLFTGLTRDDRAAIAWVNKHTPADSQFMIVSGDWNPFTDNMSEWFPALTGRRSVATLQGYEWMGESRYYKQWDEFWYLQGCQDSSCLDRWARRNRLPAETYVYLVRGCCPDLEQSLRSSSYDLEYAGPAATIYLRQQPAQRAG